MSNINIIFQSGAKPTKINTQSDITFSALVTLYYKKECISKKQQNELKFIFLGKEILSSSTSKLNELGLKDSSNIKVESKRKPRKSFTLREYHQELEREKIKRLKKEMIAREKEMRKGNITKEEEKKLQINKVLEDMCIYSNIVKKEIKKEKEENPEKFVKIEEVLKNDEKDISMFGLALLAKTLENNGVETVIEKSDNINLSEEEKKEKEEESTTCLQFLSNGYIGKNKYDLHFDLGAQRNEELLNNEEEFKKFKNDLIIKLSKDYNIPTDQIIVTFPQRGSLHVQVIFQSSEFNDLNLDDFKSKFENDDEFKELKNLKEIHKDVMFDSCKLLKSMLDNRGNRTDGWGIGELRGNKPYNPPLGWIGIGLKVMDKYDEGNNDWIGYCNSKNEWCVAYHGVGRNQSSEKVKEITGKIIKGNEKDKTNFIPGNHQAHSGHNDIYHDGKLVGNGVYCTPTIKTAEEYSGVSTINGINYKTVLMVRVKPDAIRGCNCSWAKDYWVVNGTTDEIRPYRILYKKEV